MSIDHPIDPVGLTRSLVSFDTTNAPGRERACAQYIGKLLEDNGLQVSLHEFDNMRTSLVAHSNGDGRLPICFTGHIDTVPLGNVQWSVDPFAGEIQGDRIYGIGATDMKGGVAAMITAVIAVAKISKNKAPVTVVLTAGEESGAQGAAFLSGLGHVLGKAGALVVGEPTSNYPLLAHKGALWIEAMTSGVAAHGSMPDRGVNAIYKAVQAVQQLQKFIFQEPEDMLLGKPTLNVGTIKGGNNFNSVPDRTVVGIDIRSVPGQSHEAIMADLQSCMGREVILKKIMDVAGIYTAPENPWIQQVFEIMSGLLGERPVPKGVNYFTDASILTPALGNIPTVILGPGEPQMAHKTDEYCRIPRIQQAVQAYIEIARRWCGV
jgi:succinyl-diaminopimelate desuccinylase